jgi:hypothetical protein
VLQTHGRSRRRKELRVVNPPEKGLTPNANKETVRVPNLCQPWLSARVTQRAPYVLSEDFASVLHTLKKGNGHLSLLLRCAWDRGHLPTATASELRRALDWAASTP